MNKPAFLINNLSINRYSAYYSRIFLLPLFYGLLLFIASCDTPEKVLKSTDIEYKKAKAISWYNAKEYYKCIPVFEELIGLMKGRQSTEDLYYMYANANYQQGDFLIAAYHFKNYYDLYPSNEKAEECLYMHAKSYQRLSPKPDLDQTYTLKALDAYQLFLTSFPNSKFIKEVNENVSTLRRKLEVKALAAAELYFKMRDFKASAVCYANILKQFPDIAQAELITLMIIKSSYEYAKNSVPNKKSERFLDVIKKYNEFRSRFAQSKYLAEAGGYEHDSHYHAALSAYEWAESGPLYLRESNFNNFFREAHDQMPFISDKKLADNINQKVEKGFFLIVKSDFQISEEKKTTAKLPSLQAAVKNYYNFVDKYPKSRYSKEAEKLFNNSTELIKKYKTNG